MPVLLPNLNLTQPDVGGSNSVWGNLLNTDLANIDAAFAATGTGTVIKRNAAGNAGVAGVDVSGAAGIARLISFLTTTARRWALGAETTAEPGGGSNGGSNFILQRYADNGTTVLGIPIAITRSNGAINLETIPTAAGSPVLTQATAGAFATPIGAVQMFAGSVEPPNWLICDGRTFPTATWPALFAAIGTAYNPGVISGNFTIPDLRERVPIGSRSSPSLIVQNTATLGTAIGEGTHLLTGGEMPAHNHALTDPGHKHTITPMRVGSVQNGSGASAYIPTAPITSQPTDVGAGTFGGDPAVGTGITITAQGGGAVHNNVQPSLVMNFIIRAQ